MKYIIVTVKDRATNVFGNVGSVQTRGEAIRSFADECNNPKNGQLFNHPEDFDMYELGSWDSETGLITPNDEGPKMIARAQDLAQRDIPAFLKNGAGEKASQIHNTQEI